MRKPLLWYTVLTALCFGLVLMVACTPGSPPPTTTPPISPTASPGLTSTPKSPATPTTAAISFAGKTIALVTPNAAGGSTDIITRVYARFLPKYFPGNPAVVVRNMPGGASTIASNYVYAAKPDGLTVLVSPPSARFSYLFGTNAPKYDLKNMYTPFAIAAGIVNHMKAGIVDRPEDITKARGLIYGSTPGSNTYAFIMLKELIGFPVEKLILAYTGESDAHRAFQSGEVNATGGSIPVYLSQVVPAVKKGEIMPLHQGGIMDANGNVVRVKAVPDVMTGGELYEKIFSKAPSGMPWDAYRMIIGIGASYDKAIHLAPGTPTDIARAWAEASRKLAQDPEFLKMAVTLVGESPDIMAGEEAAKGFQENLDRYASPQLIQWFKETLATKYNWSIS
ncbi:MAG: hypothetical protein HYX90_05670 [Chloroflexi bacterium]|nr:hypothetical protein [Chloroflexota bacterium]